MNKIVVVIAGSETEKTRLIFWARNALQGLKEAKAVSVVSHVLPNHKTLKALGDSSECEYFFILSSSQIRCGTDTIFEWICRSIATKKFAYMCVRDVLELALPDRLRGRILSFSTDMPACATEELLRFAGVKKRSQAASEAPAALSALG